MATDDERREVARRLREVNPYRNQSYTVPYGRYIPAVEYLSELAGALGYSPKNDVSRLGFQNRLADLIEPVGHECVPGECPLNVCHDNDRIDRDALLALADEIDGVRSDGIPYGGYELHRWQRIIREALGVTDARV